MYLYTAQIEKQLQGNLELPVLLAVYKTAGLLAWLITFTITFLYSRVHTLYTEKSLCPEGGRSS